MLEISVLFLVALVSAWALGRFMTGIYSGESHFSDRIFLPFEHRCYRVLGIDPSSGMDWKTYSTAFLISNLVLGLVAYLLLLMQHRLPLNPDGIGPLSWDLALHTAVSFLTNADQQHYSGQSQMSYLSQTLVIVSLQFVTPSMALAVCVAVLRGMVGGRNQQTAEEGEERDLGNYYVDLIRAIVRLMIPLSTVLALILVSQGVPSTYRAAQTATALD